MSVPQTVTEVLSKHVVWEVESIDRMGCLTVFGEQQLSSWIRSLKSR